MLPAGRREVPSSLFTTRSPAQFWNAKRTLQELAGHSEDKGRCDYFGIGDGDGDVGGGDAMDTDEGDEYARWPEVLQALARAHRRLGGGRAANEDGTTGAAADDEQQQQADLSLGTLAASGPSRAPSCRSVRPERRPV